MLCATGFAVHTLVLADCRMPSGVSSSGGCSGNTYIMDYATEKGKFDEEVADKGVWLVPAWVGPVG